MAISHPTDRTMTSTTTPENKNLSIKIGKNANFEQHAIAIIEQLNLEPLQKQFIKYRWLQQVMKLEKLSRRYRWRYNFTRIITIVGGVIIPALVSLNINGNGVGAIFGWLTFALSQIVAICAALEEFFHYGELYRQYRNSSELMQMEAWYYLQLSGIYKNFSTHQLAYKTFAGRVEKIIEQDLEVLIQIGQDQEKQEEKAFESSQKPDIHSIDPKNLKK